MKKNILILVLGALAMGSQAVQYKYEGFDYSADTGLRYQPGYSVSGAGGMPTNRAGSLAYAGLPDSTGGKIQLAGQSPAGTVRYVMWTTGTPDGSNVTNLFASFILNVVNVGTIQGSGFIFSVRNSTAQIMITNNVANPSNLNYS
jgi:hypothetical protein